MFEICLVKICLVKICSVMEYMGMEISYGIYEVMEYMRISKVIS